MFSGLCRWQSTKIIFNILYVYLCCVLLFQPNSTLKSFAIFAERKFTEAKADCLIDWQSILQIHWFNIHQLELKLSEDFFIMQTNRFKCTSYSNDSKITKYKYIRHRDLNDVSEWSRTKKLARYDKRWDAGI